MNSSLHHLISKRGFDPFRTGLEARFQANSLLHKIHYSEGSPNPSLLIRLESKDRLGEICAWESGHCDLLWVDLNEVDSELSFSHHMLNTDAKFHDHLAWLFRFVAKKEFPNDHTK